MTAVYFTDEQLLWLAQAWSDSPVELKQDLDPNCKFENQLLDVGAYEIQAPECLEQASK
jgi:hypothetical protein